MAKLAPHVGHKMELGRQELLPHTILNTLVGAGQTGCGINEYACKPPLPLDQHRLGPSSPQSGNQPHDSLIGRGGEHKHTLSKHWFSSLLKFEPL